MRRSRIKIMPILIIIIVVFTAATLVYGYSHKKYKDMNYAAERYITTGLLNKYKLYKIDKMDVSFSDGSLAVMSITGLQYKAPHKIVSYKMFLEKNENDIWKVKKVYSE
jgi:uncharacterized protein YpmB